MALILREAVEVAGRTAALVSPDRLLARRVAIRLEAWGIRVDDSAGRPFAKTVPGAFLTLVIGAAVSDFAPAETMALLRHPLCRIGFQAFDIRRYARALEISAFRAPYLGRGLEGIATALDNAERDRAVRQQASCIGLRSGFGKRTATAPANSVARLAAAFDPLIETLRRRRQRYAFERSHGRTRQQPKLWPFFPRVKLQRQTRKIRFGKARPEKPRRVSSASF